MVTKNAGEQGEKQENRKTKDVLYCGTKQLNCFSNQGIEVGPLIRVHSISHLSLCLGDHGESATSAYHHLSSISYHWLNLGTISVFVHWLEIFRLLVDFCEVKRLNLTWTCRSAVSSFISIPSIRQKFDTRMGQLALTRTWMPKNRYKSHLTQHMFNWLALTAIHISWKMRQRFKIYRR